MKFKTKYEAPWAETENWIKVPVADWRHRRPETIEAKCAQCGWCYLYCPSGCIVHVKNHFRADSNLCKGCGICARECPAKAIIMVDEEEE